VVSVCSGGSSSAARTTLWSQVSSSDAITMKDQPVLASLGAATMTMSGAGTYAFMRMLLNSPTAYSSMPASCARNARQMSAASAASLAAALAGMT
jgi:hypothetical protein